MCLIGTVLNGRHEGANPSSRVTELPNSKFSIQFRRPLKLEISVLSLI